MGNFSNLPADIMLDIFTRLPTESVLESKVVCKTWGNVVRDPSFAQRHSTILVNNLQSAVYSGKLSFILTVEDLSKKLFDPFQYLEYDDEVSSHRVKEMNFKNPFDMYSVLGSCNGLICLIGLPSYYTLDESSSTSYVPYIFNPITREVVTLPELDRSKYYKLVDYMACGFGYVASTNEYKVVRLYTFKRDRKYAQIDVYTLGSGKGWRDVGKIDCDADFFSPCDAKFVNGFLYWDFGYGTEVFDLADEKFVGYSQLYDHLWYRVLGRHLCGIHFNENKKSSDVWLLKKKEDESFGWCKEFSLISMDSYNTPLALTRSGTVLGHSETKLHLYDLKSSSSKILEDFGIGINDAIPHINTLVSLQALGEENTKTLESGESAIEEAKGRVGR